MEAIIHHADCFDAFRSIEDNSIDAVITDPPYETTDCSWDSILNLEKMWLHLKRITKPHGAIVLFCNEPFTSKLISSNFKGFKYRWTWDKQIPSGMGFAKHQPMRQVEDIAVFERDGKKVKYNPQMILREAPIKAGGNNKRADTFGKGFKKMGEQEFKKEYTHKYPTSLISFAKVRQGSVHPTQKPLKLMEYLVQTHSDVGDTVIDFAMGSGSTGVACVNLGRRFIGIEKEEKYFQIAEKRVYAV